MARPANSTSPSGEASRQQDTARRHAPVSAMAVVLALLPVAAAVYGNRSTPPGPALHVTRNPASLVFSEYLHFYGDEPIEPTSLVESGFQFSNQGTVPVEITDIVPSCGCLRPRLSSRQLGPGETGVLLVPIQTANEAPGPHEYTVTVKYADPEPREATVSVKLVLPAKKLLVEPKSIIVMGNSSRGIEHMVTVTDSRENPVAVTGVSSSSPLFTPSLRDVSRDDNGLHAQVAVAITDTLPAGNHRGLIRVSTDDPEQPYLFVPVLAKGSARPAEDQVFVSPEYLLIDTTTAAQTPSEVMVGVPSRWRVSHVDTFPEELSAEYRRESVSGTDLQRLIITLSLRHPLHRSVEDGIVTIHADEGREMVSVPVRFRTSAPVATN